MWHTVLLGRWKELFFWLPIEDLIRLKQDEYYEALAQADKDGDSSAFVRLMLQIIRDTLTAYENVTDQDTDQDNDQVKAEDPNVEKLLKVIGNRTLSAVEIMKEMGLNHRPTFRKNYLNPALELEVIERTVPDKPNSRNQRYRKRSF